MTSAQNQKFLDLARAAEAHHAAGRHQDAEAAYRAALAASPDHPAILQNLAAIRATQGDEHGAIALFDRALVAAPGNVAATYNRAIALTRTGRTEDAIHGLRRTLALDPAHYDAHRTLAFLYLANHDRDRALDHFARTYDLRRGDDRSTIANASLTHASCDKLRHDAEQFRYIAAARRDARRFDVLARAYDAIASQLPDGIAPLSPEDIEDLGEDYNTAINVFSAAEVAGPAISPELDPAVIASEFETSGRTAIAIDNVLSAPALSRLRRYLLESTVWHDFSHIGGFVASYLEDGLASPLMLQIADELRQTLPDILGPHPLTQAWAFKGLEPDATVDLHADDAAISVNLWLTPNTANSEPETGGLIVYIEPPPADWVITGYDEDHASIDEFARKHAGTARTFPYAENRAVVFTSRLFHGSHRPTFRPGYANHRINLTLLYGHHAQ